MVLQLLSLCDKLVLLLIRSLQFRFELVVELLEVLPVFAVPLVQYIYLFFEDLSLVTVFLLELLLHSNLIQNPLILLLAATKMFVFSTEAFPQHDLLLFQYVDLSHVHHQRFLVEIEFLLRLFFHSLF